MKAKRLLELVPVDQQAFLAWLGVKDVFKPFRFAREDRKQLRATIDRARGSGRARRRERVAERPGDRRQAVSEARELIEALEFVVLLYQISTRPEERPPSLKRRHVSELKKLRSAAAKLDEAIAAVSPYTKRRIVDEALVTEWAEGVGRAEGGFPVAHLDEGVFLQALRSIVSETERELLVLRQRSPAGRPRDLDRDALEELALDVGRVLRYHGIAVKKYRAGCYAWVYKIVRKAIKRPLPDEELSEIVAVWKKLRYEASEVPRAGPRSFVRQLEASFLRHRSKNSVRGPEVP